MKHPDRLKVTTMVPAGVSVTMQQLQDQARAKMAGEWRAVLESLTNWRDGQRVYECEFIELIPLSREEKLEAALRKAKALASVCLHSHRLNGGPGIEPDPFLDVFRKSFQDIKDIEIP